MQSPLDFGCCRSAGCGQVEQILLLGVEPGQLSLEVGLALPGVGLLVAQRAGDGRLQCVDQFRLQASAVHLVSDVSFNFVRGQVRQFAGLALPAGAVEVVITPAIAPGAHKQQPVGDVALTAAVAEQAAFEVVLVAALPLTGPPPGPLNVLDLQPGVDVNQWFMPPADLFLLASFRVRPLDEAEVVAITEHRGKLGVRDRTGRVPPWSGGQTTVGQLVSQSLLRVVASCVQLESQPDERATVGIDLDGTDLTAILTKDPDVSVTDRSSAN